MVPTSRLALSLACLGLYGVTAYVVAQRTGEIGIRTALGASRAKVIAMVLRGALFQIGCAAAIGVPAAVTAARLLESQVYGVKTSDPLALGRATVLLLGCALVAGLIPANRASRVGPNASVALGVRRDGAVDAKAEKGTRLLPPAAQRLPTFPAAPLSAPAGSCATRRERQMDAR